jgi:phospholipid/cholesterol/gamma-HCH transport system substrate-binding protein
MEYKNIEIKVGLMIFICMVMLGGLLLFVGGKDLFKKTYEVKVRFAFTDGLEDNAPVRFAGVEVGKVTAVRIIPEKEVDKNDIAMVEVTLKIDKDLVLRQDGRIGLNTMGLMGGKYVSLSGGTMASPAVKPGQTLRGEDPLEMARLMEEGREVLTNLKKVSLALGEIISNNKAEIDETIINLRNISKGLSDNLEGILIRLESLLNNTDAVLTANREDIRETIKNLKEATDNAREFTRKIKERPSTLLWGSREKERKDKK